MCLTYIVPHFRIRHDENFDLTRVYSWNTYPVCLSVRCQIDSACIFMYGSMSYVADCNYHSSVWSTSCTQATFSCQLSTSK